VQNLQRPRRTGKKSYADIFKRFINLGEKMGHKGVSKRKPPQVKAKPLSKDNVISSVFSVGRASGPQLLKSPDTNQAIAPAARGNSKHSSDSRKNPKKH
jgi:hypothetical protein